MASQRAPRSEPGRVRQSSAAWQPLRVKFMEVALGLDLGRLRPLSAPRALSESKGRPGAATAPPRAPSSLAAAWAGPSSPPPPPRRASASSSSSSPRRRRLLGLKRRRQRRRPQQRRRRPRWWRRLLRLCGVGQGGRVRARWRRSPSKRSPRSCAPVSDVHGRLNLHERAPDLQHMLR